MTVTTESPSAPGPASAGPGRLLRQLSGRAAAVTPGRIVAATGKPLFWILLILFILVPCASSLLLTISPHLFDQQQPGQGAQWFTLTYLRQAFTGTTAIAITNSLWVSGAAAGLGLAVGFPIAWLANRTTLPGHRFVPGSMWLVLLLPSWLPAIGWERIVQSQGVMYRLGMNWPWVTHLIMGPFGVVLLLGLRSVPFTYLAITAGLAGLGQEFEDAARVHGACRAATLRLIWPMLAPAIWSALAINFAEAISDFGVAATLAYNSNFTLATYQLYAAINNFPPSFPAASAMGLLLVAAVAIPLALQARALRGRSYQMLSGRTRQAVRRELRGPGKAAALGGMGLFYVIALGVPGFGAVSASLLGDYGGSFSLTLVNYRALFHQVDQFGPLERSIAYGFVSASVTVIGGFIAAWLLAQRRQKSSRVLDFMLLAAVALPSVVFGAGYIFAFNLPLLSRLGINLYQTATLLVIAYTASSLPTNARVLVGAVSQLQPSLRDAARTHGAGEMMAWIRGVLPVVSRPITMAWLLTFCGVFLELPLSQKLLYAPSNPPASVAIQDNLSNYHFGVGMAQSVLAVAIAMAAVGLVLGGYRLLAPQAGAGSGRRPVAESRTAETRTAETRAAQRGSGASPPGHAQSISVEQVSKEYPGGSVALREVSLEVEPGSFVVLLGPSGSGKTTLLRCLAGIERVTSGKIAIGGTTVASESAHVPPDRRDLSMVFQDYALWPHLRVRENVAFALRRAKLAKPDAQARTLAMLNRVGLGALAERYPNELSGGEQQRVALARALVAGTGLILCDEPLSNLDADLRERMRVEISSLVRQSGATAIYITHDQAEAFALADKVGLLQNGRLVQFGRPEQIYTEPATPFVARFTGLSGELAVRVAGQAAAAADGTVEIGPDGSALLRPCRARTSASWASSGDGVLLIRPTGVHLGGTNDGDHHLAGTVADVAFRGRGYEHAIDIAGHGRLTGIFAPVRAERGETVGLRLDPAGCYVFPAAR